VILLSTETEEDYMLLMNKSLMHLTENALSLCLPMDTNFDDWCYDNGIYELPSNGSIFGTKLGITYKDLDKVHRFDLAYQCGKLSDALLRKRIPVLALIAKMILYLKNYLIDFRYRHVDFNQDLDLEL